MIFGSFCVAHWYRDSMKTFANISKLTEASFVVSSGKPDDGNRGYLMDSLYFNGLLWTFMAKMTQIHAVKEMSASRLDG